MCCFGRDKNKAAEKQILLILNLHSFEIKRPFTIIPSEGKLLMYVLINLILH